LATPALTTLHGRLDVPDLEPLYRAFPDVEVVSISDAQREPLPWLNYAATIYHGLPPEATEPTLSSGGYLAFLGRASPEKGVDHAIEIARRVDMPLRVAAKVDTADADYFRDEIEPLLAHAHVEFMGEISEAEKPDFLGHAAALLFPIDWPEPFGLVMIEAMACGTPVVAYRRGSVAEVIDEGSSGFVVDGIDAAIAAVPAAVGLSRAGVRAAFERRFTVERMARDYVRVYERMITRSRQTGWAQAGQGVADTVAVPIEASPLEEGTQAAAHDQRSAARPDPAASTG
jgi:glycosyltransferase involved in cell wall biosynthesis